MGMGLPGVVLPGLGIPGLGGMPGLGVPGLGNASRIVVLKNAVDVEELRNPQDYTEIVQDMQVGRARRRFLLGRGMGPLARLLRAPVVVATSSLTRFPLLDCHWQQHSTA